MATQPPAGVQGLFHTPFLDKAGNVSRPWLKWLQGVETKTRGVISELGVVQPASVDFSLGYAGVVQPTNIDFSLPYTNKSLQNVPDGATRLAVSPTQQAGATRAATAIGANGILSSSFVDTPVNSIYTVASGLGLTQSGTSTAIDVASGQLQFGSGLVSYGSGSVDPGAYGTYYIYCLDPTYSGGAVTYFATTNFSEVTATDGTLYLGAITTVSAGGGSGGGGGGHSGGGGHVSA